MGEPFAGINWISGMHMCGLSRLGHHGGSIISCERWKNLVLVGFFLLTADQSFVCHCITNAYFFMVNSQCQHSGWLVICCDRILAFGSSQLGATRCPMESFSLYQLRYLETSSPTNLVVGCETWLLLSWNVPTKFPEGPTLCVYPHASTWVFQSHSRTSFV